MNIVNPFFMNGIKQPGLDDIFYEILRRQELSCWRDIWWRDTWKYQNNFSNFNIFKIPLPTSIFSKWSMAGKSFGRSMEKWKEDGIPTTPTKCPLKGFWHCLFCNRNCGNTKHTLQLIIVEVAMLFLPKTINVANMKSIMAASEVTLSLVIACFPNQPTCSCCCYLLLTSTSISFGRTWLGDSQDSNRRVCHQLLQVLSSYEQSLATLPQENWDVD